ncbi:hypothetical protein M405DRAFT_868142 [Rhizopogon salebrosus TDB-379]|nr:hypothetical protein M405DRAFT_868142 [Rhizopogon salebrosus TDB-379]
MSGAPHAHNDKLLREEDSRSSHPYLHPSTTSARALSFRRQPLHYYRTSLHHDHITAHQYTSSPTSTTLPPGPPFMVYALAQAVSMTLLSSSNAAPF